MHFCIYVTNTNRVSLDEQMKPFDEATENEEYLGREYYCKAGEYEAFLEKRLAWSSKADTIKSLLASKDTKAMRDWILEYEGGEADEEGGLYYEGNPNAKWDWYVVGGRWNNYLVDKKGKPANALKKQDISFEVMQKEREKLARREYQVIKEDFPDSWPAVLCVSPNTTEEEYVSRVSVNLMPYGILHDGEWLDKDNCGDFEKEFTELWESLSPDTEITVVDVHI